MRSSTIVLASGSAARLGLLTAAGITVRVETPAIDEGAVKRAAREEGLEAWEAAIRLARLKALSVRAGGALVIGADQLLVSEEAWFDKPADLAAARRHLLALRGRAHRLETACVVVRDGGEIWSEVSSPRLVMRAFSEAFLDEYLAAEGAALLGCVGAYRIEGRGAQLFERVEGEHAAIVGLPLLGLLGCLRREGAIAS